MNIKHGATDQSITFVLVDADGVEATGLTITDLDIVYVRDRAAAVKADLTALSAVTDAHSDNKAIEIDATNAPGLYRVDFPDAAFVSGVDRVQLIINGAAIKPAYIEVELVAKLVSDLIDAAAPSAATVASQVRTELGTELGRIDAAISSRNATTPPTAEAIREELDENSSKLYGLMYLFNQFFSTVEVDGLGNYQFTAKALENAPSAPSADAIKTAIEAAGSHLALIKAKTDNLPASPAATGAAMTLTEGERTSIADAVWATTTRTLSSFGSLVADMAAAVWAYTGRALTVNPPTAAAIRSELDNNSTKLGLIDAATAQLASTLESDGDGGHRFTADALENVPTSEPEWTPEEKAAALAALEELIKFGKCDIVINTDTIPWQEEYRNASTSELLYYKHLYKLDGSPITSINDYAAYKVENELP